MAPAGSSPCASCKLLRRRCTKDCVFAPYFPSDDPQRFAIVHKVFGASNISKMLQELPVQQRSDAVGSLVFEANARMRDPVYGCVGAISYLQTQVSQLQMQLAMAQAEILCFQMQQQDPTSTSAGAPLAISQQQQTGGEHNSFSFCNSNNSSSNSSVVSYEYNNNNGHFQHSQLDFPNTLIFPESLKREESLW
ncbi:hypothetical protein V2J09_019015 [Rumex salicifolius]